MIRSKIAFLESATFQFHAGMLSSVMDIYRILGSSSLSVSALLNFSGKANTSIHGLGGDDKANCRPAREAPETQMTKNKRHSDLQARQNYHLFSKKRKR